MTPAPEPTIYDITDIPFFAWDPPSLAWFLLSLIALFFLANLFFPRKWLNKKTIHASPSVSAQEDTLSCINDAILNLSDESISKASIRAKRFISGTSDTEISDILNALDLQRYAPGKSEEVLKILMTLKDKISRVQI